MDLQQILTYNVELIMREQGRIHPAPKTNMN